MDVTPPGGPRGAEHDDPESADAVGAAGAGSAGTGGGAGAGPTVLDLSPATQRHAGSGRRGRGRSVWGIALLVVVLGGLAVVLFNGLNDAATFFYNVDEAVARRGDLQGDRFRMQGNVVPGSVRDTAEGVTFDIAYHGARVSVDHVGDPPELFGPEIPVVLEGTFRGPRFESDQILIRHDNAYDEKNPDRIRDAERDAQQTRATTTGGTGASGGAG